MKKTLTLVLAILVGASVLFGMKQNNPKRLTTNKDVVLLAGQNIMVPQSLLDQEKQVTLHKRQNDDSGIFPVKVQNTGEENVSRDCSGGDCWNLQHVGEDTQWYLGSGDAGDTMAIAFQAAVPCIVQEVYIKWFDGGNVTAFGASMSDEAIAATNGTGASVNMNDGTVWARGTAPFTPIGTLQTNPTPNSIPDYTPDWTLQMDIGGTFQVGDETDLSDNPPFLIVFVKGGVQPHPLAADVFTGMSYNWFGGPWTSGPDGDVFTPDGDWGDGYGWGNYQSSGSLGNGVIDHAVQVRVTYPWGAPIAANPGILPNTYATDDTRTVPVDLFDDVEDGFGIDANDVVEFHWAIDGAEQAPMFLDEASLIDVGADGNGVYGFDITYSAGAGSEISYWIVATDNNGLDSQTTPISFLVVAPSNPDADLLFIADSDHQYYFGQYEDVATALGYNFEVWNVKENNGIDYSVINHGWTNIIVYGWGNQSLPAVAGEVDPGYGDFLANGGDLLIADQDWFYGHGLDSNPVFGAGDPAYDWFGLSGGTNDPDDDGDSGNGGSGDTTITALAAGLPDMHLQNAMYGTSNWSDFLEPDLATAIFQGEQTENVVGTAYETAVRGSKRVCLGFTADAAVDTTETGEVYYTDEFASYVEYFLTWFDVASPPQPTIASGPSDIIYNDAGQEVTADVFDVNGDDFTVALWWTVNGGAPESVAMTLAGRALYTGTIPAMEGGSNVEYWVEATDADGTASSATGTYFVFAPTSDVLFVLNNEMDAGSYPGLYYFYDAYGTGDLWQYPDFWLGAVNADLLGFYDTVFEINSTGTWANFADHYAVIADWLATGNKNYFVAGDEMLGMLYGWADMDFADGDFWYDLGITHVYNDIGSGGAAPSPLDAVAGDLLSGPLYDGVMALGDGSYVEYDPDYEIGLTNWMDGFSVREDANALLWDQATGYAVGVYRTWANGNKTVLLGIDPLAVNSAPTYVWWGATQEGPTKMSLDWFHDLLCEGALGDVNGDGNTDILDVVQLVGGILGTVTLEDCSLVYADANEDGSIDILDVVLIVSWILNPRGDNATSASILQTENGVELVADGYVGGIQMDLIHGDDFSIELSDNAYVADYVTNGNTTTVLIVAPEGELFTVSGDYQIENVIGATTDGYLEVGVNAPTEFSLSTAYPNPFNPTTSFNLNIPADGQASVKVYNVVGQLVKVLVDDNMTAGYHTITWDASNVPSGMYLIRAEVGSNIATQKVMLLK